jgi:hypothetical protein
MLGSRSYRTFWGLLALAPVLIGADDKGCKGAAEEQPCAATQECAAEEYCTTETGTCNRPPGCDAGQVCSDVCYGVCTASVCRAQQVSFPTLHCVQLPQGYRWTGSACVAIRGCPGTCRGADCDALYSDAQSCQDAHRVCVAAP